MRTFLAVALAALAGCSSPPPPLRQERPSIVSLNPCADAVLAEVADPAQILAISHYSHDPRSSSMDQGVAHRFRATGGTVEEVMALRPDLVIAGSFLPPATAQALTSLGIRVERLPVARTLAQSMEQVRRIAELAGQERKGAALVQRIEQAVAQAAPPARERRLAAVVWQSGGIVPGRDALISDLLVRTGFRNHSVAQGLRQADYLPLEAMIADPPQIILTAGTPGDGEDRMLAHPALDELAGVRRARFEPSLLYCGGPTIIRAVGRLARIRRGLAS